LTIWLQKFTSQNQQADSAKTYVAKGLAHHPIGIVLLARLAVDAAEQGKGLGKALLFDALKRVEAAADIVGLRAVMVHAIDDAARQFYEYFTFDRSPIDPFQLMLLLKDVRKAL
jgi:GNAT superfamily N-acetyltransferase